MREKSVGTATGVVRPRGAEEDLSSPPSSEQPPAAARRAAEDSARNVRRAVGVVIVVSNLEDQWKLLMARRGGYAEVSKGPRLADNEVLLATADEPPPVALD